MRVPVKRPITEHPLVYVPLGLIAFGLVAFFSTLWPPQRPRDPGSID